MLLALAIGSVVGIACTSVAFLPTDASRTYPPTSSVQVFWENPTKPYEVLGMVSAERGGGSDERLFKALKERAMEAGADAVIIRGAVAQTGNTGVPLATGGFIIVPGTKRLEALAIRFTDRSELGNP